MGTMKMETLGESKLYIEGSVVVIYWYFCMQL